MLDARTAGRRTPTLAWLLASLAVAGQAAEPRTEHTFRLDEGEISEHLLGYRRR